jgi:hypothetical protein
MLVLMFPVPPTTHTLIAVHSFVEPVLTTEIQRHRQRTGWQARVLCSGFAGDMFSAALRKRERRVIGCGRAAACGQHPRWRNIEAAGAFFAHGC